MAVVPGPAQEPAPPQNSCQGVTRDRHHTHKAASLPLASEFHPLLWVKLQISFSCGDFRVSSVELPFSSGPRAGCSAGHRHFLAVG